MAAVTGRRALVVPGMGAGPTLGQIATESNYRCIYEYVSGSPSRAVPRG